MPWRILLSIALIPMISEVSVYSVEHTACGGFPVSVRATASPSVLSSPGYPNDYQPNSQCSWLITAPLKTLIRFTFQDLRTETDYDTLTIYDRESDSNSTLGRFSGIKLPGTCYTTQNIAFLNFSTDKSVQDKGFRLSFMYVDSVECGAQSRRLATSVPGVILSPGFPGNYPPSTTCSWNITAPPGLVIFFSFNLLDTELNGDIISVNDGLTSSDPSLGAFSGSLTPSSFGTTGPQALLTFKSDAAGTSRGFQISFMSGKYICGTYNMNATTQPSTITSPLYPRPYPKNVDCMWELTALPGEVIIIKPEFLQLSSGDSLEVFNGNTSYRSDRVGYFSGSSNSTSFTTTIPFALLRFKSDSSSNSFDKGFNVTFRSVIYCGDPGTPVNGRRVGDDFTLTSSIAFSCNSMYMLSDDGNILRTCQDDGHWSKSQPKCNINATLVTLAALFTVLGVAVLGLITYVIYHRCNKDSVSRITQVAPAPLHQVGPRLNNNGGTLRNG